MIQVHVSLRTDLFNFGMWGLAWHEEIHANFHEDFGDEKWRAWSIGWERSEKGLFLTDSEIAKAGRRVGQGLKDWKATTWMICIHGGSKPPEYNPGPNETFPVLSAHRLEVFQEALRKGFEE